MKLKITYLILSITIILIAACNTKNNKVIKNENKSGNKNDYTIEIYDSIVFDINQSDKYVICGDYLPSKKLFIGYSYFSNTILILNSKGETIGKIDKYGNAYDEYNRIEGLNFYNDTSIIVQTLYHFLYYTFDGKFIKSQFINAGLQIRCFNSVSNVLFKNKGNTYMITNNNKSPIKKTPNLFAVSNLNDTSDFRYFGQYEEDNEFPLKKFQSGNFLKIWTSNKAYKYFYLSYAFDSSIYVYDMLNDFKYVKKVICPFDHFPAVEVLSANEQSREKSFELKQKNPFVSNMIAFDSILLISYSSGVPENKIAKNMEEANKTHSLSYSKRYLSVVINDEKKGHDILLENNRKEKILILNAINIDSIFMLRLSPNKSENEPSIIYLARLKKVAEEK